MEEALRENYVIVGIVQYVPVANKAKMNIDAGEKAVMISSDFEKIKWRNN